MTSVRHRRKNVPRKFIQHSVPEWKAPPKIRLTGMKRFVDGVLHEKSHANRLLSIKTRARDIYELLKMEAINDAPCTPKVKV